MEEKEIHTSDGPKLKSITLFKLMDHEVAYHKVAQSLLDHYPKEGIKMEMFVEKRMNERHDHKSLITVAYFNTVNYCSAKSVNYSKDGICFESDYAFKPGTTICFRREKGTSAMSGIKTYEGCRTVALAEIRWNKEISNGKGSYYAIGAKYYAQRH